MRYGNNYARHLEGELAHARWQSDLLDKISSAAESDFCRSLPPDETPLELSEESLNKPEIVVKREAFRKAHSNHSSARSIQATIEDEYFSLPEDFY